MIIEFKRDEDYNYLSVFEQAYNIKKIRQLIKKQKFTVNGAYYYDNIVGEFMITHIKKVTNHGYSVNIKIKGQCNHRRWYWNNNTTLIPLESIKDISDVKRRNKHIRNACIKEISEFLKYFSVPYYNIVIGNVKICSIDETL
jgi:hypothetical protein